jgi:hypothetical protein
VALNLLRDETTVVSDADLVPGGDPGTSYTIRKLTPEKSREIRKAHTTKRLDRRTHQYLEDIDADALQDALLDYCLAAWEGVTDGSEPAPCVLANKLRLDWERRAAILRDAGANAIAKDGAATADSFRPSA